MVKLYIDASWAGELTDQRSTSRYCSYVWGNLVTWRSKKQSVVARSSIEYWVVDLEMFGGFKKLLKELRIKTQSPFKILCELTVK